MKLLQVLKALAPTIKYKVLFTNGLIDLLDLTYVELNHDEINKYLDCTVVSIEEDFIIIIKGSKIV